MQKKERITKILEHLNHGIYERNETISVSLLAALAEQNIFLFGPPGTAKSLISRRLAQAFETNNYFEYLMQRFSIPEEVFGPVSLMELKKDNYVRKTSGFLPKADFAFLDEIWKSSPAILNTLLTIINEKIFRNGSELEKVPLKALISASNEIPPEKQGLEALYDRFLIRLHISPMKEKEHFETLLQSNPTNKGNKLPNELLIKNQEWEEWKHEIEETQLSEEVLNIIHDIRLTFSEKAEELNLYVSDRRWQRAATLLKASAFFCDREQTNLIDALLLKHCLWTNEENREVVKKIVEDTVRNCGLEIELDLNEIAKEKNTLEDEILTELERESMSMRLQKIFTNEVKNIEETFDKKIQQVQEDLTIFKKEMETPFVPEEDRKIALESIKQQLQDLQLQKKDCERMKHLIDGTLKPTKKKPPKKDLSFPIKSSYKSTTLTGHNEYVRSVCFSPDGKLLASGSSDETIKLWETKSRQCLNTLEEHRELVNSVCFSPDGKLLASGSDDETIKLWETNSGQCLSTLTGHGHNVRSVCFSPDGKLLASGSNDETIKLWETNSGQCLNTLEEHRDIVYSVCFSPDGKLLASGSHDETIKLWETKSGQCLNTLIGHRQSVHSVCFSPDGKLLASGSNDKTIRLWETDSGQCLKNLTGHGHNVYSVCFSPDGKLLASGSSDETIKLWETKSGKCLNTLEEPNNSVLSVCFSPDGKLLASGSSDNTIKLWS